MPTTTIDLHEDGARRALLARLATGLVTVAEPWRYQWTCCWLPYTGPRGEQRMWQMCGREPGTPYGPGSIRVPCGHWHHQWEVFLA